VFSWFLSLLQQVTEADEPGFGGISWWMVAALSEWPMLPMARYSVVEIRVVPRIFAKGVGSRTATVGIASKLAPTIASFRLRRLSGAAVVSLPYTSATAMPQRMYSMSP